MSYEDIEEWHEAEKEKLVEEYTAIVQQGNFSKEAEEMFTSKMNQLHSQFEKKIEKSNIKEKKKEQLIKKMKKVKESLLNLVHKNK